MFEREINDVDEYIQCQPAQFPVPISQWERIKKKLTEGQKPADNSDYAKCADDILTLDCANEVVNKRNCLVVILKRHFAL